jgi:muramoyltetrapeptide carboxypeptidase
VIAPRRLPAQATLGVCGLSGRVDPAPLERGVQYLKSLGHEVIVAPETTLGWRYFAGTDEERVAGLHGLLADDRIDMILASRGGYGLSRLMHLINWDRVCASRKIFVGFSDYTALNCAAFAAGGLVTFQGPMVASDFGSNDPSEFAREHFWAAMKGERHEITAVPCAHPYSPQKIEGTLWGGNLALLAHLVGTPYMPRIDDGILFVEEIAEDPYAIERMFLQLLHGGLLDRQRALVLCDFTDCKPNNPDRYPYAMDEVIESLRDWLPCPVLTGFPFGHIARKVTLPFGAPATLSLGTADYSLAFSGHLG